MCYYIIFFFKQKTAYEMRISDWSSDVCSSDLAVEYLVRDRLAALGLDAVAELTHFALTSEDVNSAAYALTVQRAVTRVRSEEHTSELQSLMRISYAVFCLKKKKKRMRTRIRMCTTLSNTMAIITIKFTV